MSKPAKAPAQTAEVKSVSIEVKAEAEGIITAYASVFGGAADSYGDLVQRGAFVKTVQERKDRIKVLYNHDYYSNLPVGKPISMIEDTYGLLTSTKMSATQLGQDIYTLAQEGALSEMSIGYSAVKAEYPENDPLVWRVITEAKLYEYSFVTFPANEAAVITGIKSGTDLEREVKRWATIAALNLKAGRTLSGANAKRIQSALKELQDLLTEAGVEEAAEDSTFDDTTSEEKGSREPREHSSLLTALQQKNRQLGADEKKGSLLSELRSFGARLGGQA